VYTNGTDPAERWQARLAATARAFAYPRTPDLLAAVRPAALAAPRLAPAPSRRPARPAARRLSWAYGLALVAVLLVALLSVPGVRAGVLRFLQLGAVRILLGPTETPTTAPTTAALTPTPRPPPTPLSSVLDIAGETTLAEAREHLSFPIRLPAYPADLGEPDRVYVQGQSGPEGGAALILVWLAPDDPGRVRLALYMLDSEAVADKLYNDVVKKAPPELETAVVDGRVAIWTTGPYVLQTPLGWLVERRLIQGHVLIWADEALTYRLETDLPLDEAVRIAESLE
jgi:hypothetical protein